MLTRLSLVVPVAVGLAAGAVTVDVSAAPLPATAVATTAIAAATDATAAPDTEAGPWDTLGVSRRIWLAWGKMAVAMLGGLVFVFAWVRREDPDPKTRRLAGPIAVACGGGALLVAVLFAAGLWGLLLLVPLAAAAAYLRGKKNGGEAWRLGLRGALASVCLASALTWVNFGGFHGWSTTVHYWEAFHYTMGSKYFPETGYELLYHCAAIAEAEDRPGADFSDRTVRDLANNEIHPMSAFLADEAPCREAFAADPRRWDAFRQDVRSFRRLMGPSWFPKVLRDHGYNASPLWTAMGRVLTNAGWRDQVAPPGMEWTPDTQRSLPRRAQASARARAEADFQALQARLAALAAIDFVLYGVVFALVGWAFGLGPCALAMLLWGCGYPWEYYWTGGAIGRVPWLLCAVAGVCLLRKGYHALGGAGLATSALFQVFPAALFGGIAAHLGWQLAARRRLERSHVRLIAGAALAFAVLLPVGAVGSGGWDAYPAFLRNSLKHTATPLTNDMGLQTVLGFDWSKRAAETKDEALIDPFSTWKAGHTETLRARRPLVWLATAALFALVVLCARRLEAWEAATVSVLLIYATFELTCYYYNVALLLGPLAYSDRRRTVAVVVLAFGSQMLHLAIGWIDLRYVIQALLMGGVLVYVTADLWWRRRRATDSAPASVDPLLALGAG